MLSLHPLPIVTSLLSLSSSFLYSRSKETVSIDRTLFSLCTSSTSLTSSSLGTECCSFPESVSVVGSPNCDSILPETMTVSTSTVASPSSAASSSSASAASSASSGSSSSATSALSSSTSTSPPMASSSPPIITTAAITNHHNHNNQSQTSVSISSASLSPPPTLSQQPTVPSSTHTSANSTPPGVALSLKVESLVSCRQCVGCQQPIRDRYLMCLSDNCYWHESCLHCTVCRILLTHSCYVKERKLYCKSDYKKIYAKKCSGCLEPIGSSEFVMRASNLLFHVACFSCFRCGRQLAKGDQYGIVSGMVVCKHDMDNEKMALAAAAAAAAGYHHHHNSQLSALHHHHSGLHPIMHNNSTIHQSQSSSSSSNSNKLANDPLGPYSGLNGSMSPSIDSQLTLLQPHTPQDGSTLDSYSPRNIGVGANAGNTICDSAGQLISIKTESYHSPPNPGSRQPSLPQPNMMNSGPGGGHIPIKQDGRRGPKRPRTILTTSQRRAFKSSFEVSQKPCRKVRETLAKETGLSVRIVQVWFQNQRAKLKKIQRKQQQQQMVHGHGGMLMGNGSESGGGMGSSDKSKDDSSDEDDDEDDESRQFSLPSVYHMIQSPDEGSYYSARDDDGYCKSDLGAMDDSEDASLCELDDGMGLGRGSSSGGGGDLGSGGGGSCPDLSTLHHNLGHNHSLNSSTPVSSVGLISLNLNGQDGLMTTTSSSSATLIGGLSDLTNSMMSGVIRSHPPPPPNSIMFSPPPPGLSHSPHHHGIPSPFHHHSLNQHLHNINQFPSSGGVNSNSGGATNNISNSSNNSATTNGAAMTPIDKLYSMQNSYFSNPPECEC